MKKTTVSKKRLPKQKKLSIVSWSRSKLPRSKPKLAFLGAVMVLVLSTVAYSGMYYMNYRSFKTKAINYRWGPQFELRRGGMSLLYSTCKVPINHPQFGPLFDIYVLFDRARTPTTPWNTAVYGLRYPGGDRQQTPYGVGSGYNGKQFWGNASIVRVTISAWLKDAYQVNASWADTIDSSITSPALNPEIFTRNC